VRAPSLPHLSPLSGSHTCAGAAIGTGVPLLHLPRLPDPDLPIESLLPLSQDAVFCGHLVTDMDSIAGAIGAAELYGGLAARASEINSETAFALEYWGEPQPPPIEEVLVRYPDAGVCLVDHQQTSQVSGEAPLSPQASRPPTTPPHHASLPSTPPTTAQSCHPPRPHRRCH